MKVRIESDGGPGGTRVIDQQGNDISSQISSVTFRHDGGGIPTVELELGFIAISTIDTPARMIGPRGKEVARVLYMDGTEDVFDAVN